MDRNTIIGLLLIGALLIGYSILTRPSEEELAERQRIRDSITRVEQQRILEAELEKAKSDSLNDRGEFIPAQNTEQSLQDNSQKLYGSFYTATQGEEDLITLENNFLKIQLNTKGGEIHSVELKDFKKHDGEDLILFNGDSTRFDLNFFSENRGLSTNMFYFMPVDDVKLVDASQSKKQIVLRAYASNDGYIEYKYALEPDSYYVDFDISFVGLQDVIARTSFVDLEWVSSLPQQEKGFRFESQYTSLYYKLLGDKVEHFNARKSGAKEEYISTKLKWVGYKQQFFSSVLIADDHLANATMNSVSLDESTGYLKRFESNITLPVAISSNANIPLGFYFGPNHYKTLKSYGNDLEDLVDLGWPFISWINKVFVVNIFYYLESSIKSYGIVILLLTIFFKLIMFPLTYRSYKSSAKMRVLKPQVDEINKKFSKDKAVERQQATMALYKKVGVNPMGGCLPTLLQFPIFLALFRFFPASIELRQKSFLWASDLSSYDSIIDLPFTIPAYGDHISLFTLLMAGSMMLTYKLNQGQMGDANNQMPGMKFMMYLMPVMMLIWFNSYASGLSYYYFVSNIISFLQMVIIKRFTDEEAILAKLNEKKKKTPKKSKFQARLEEMAKQRGYNSSKK